jgi:hypothetical protein
LNAFAAVSPIKAYLDTCVVSGLAKDGVSADDTLGFDSVLLTVKVPAKGGA